MKYELRDYQKSASDAAVKFFLADAIQHNGLIVCPTGSGKSIIIADIAYRLNSNVLVFCPSKEILEQNYDKAQDYGIGCAIYSASVNKKEIATVTFCTIGSVKNVLELFTQFKYILIDEAHLVSCKKKTMYAKFLSELNCKVIGLTATPYRLETTCQIDRLTNKPKLETAKSWLQMLTDYKKPVFKEIIYNIQIEELLKRGYLAKIRYFDVRPKGWEQVQLFKNTAGSEYSDKSVKYAYSKTKFSEHLTNVVRRLLYNTKTGIKRTGILVFTRYVEEAMELALSIDGCAIVSGNTPKHEREEILRRFKTGEIQVVANAACLTTGFDFPALDTVVKCSSHNVIKSVLSNCRASHQTASKQKRSMVYRSLWQYRALW